MQEKTSVHTPGVEHVEPKVMGRPVKPLDADQIYKLAVKHWSYEEIGAFFNVSGDTIKRRFKDLIDLGKLEGKAYIRDLQWKRAMEGSDRMILHLSEQRLGERSKIEIKSDVTVVPGDKLKELNSKVQSLVEEKVEWEKQRLLSQPKS